MSECIQVRKIFPTCSEQLFDLRLVSEVVIFPCLLVYSACRKFCLSCSLIHLVENFPQGLQHLCCCHNGNTSARTYSCFLSCYVSCPPFFPFWKIFRNRSVSLFQRTNLSLPSLLSFNTFYLTGVFYAFGFVSGLPLPSSGRFTLATHSSPCAELCTILYITFRRDFV